MMYRSLLPCFFLILCSANASAMDSRCASCCGETQPLIVTHAVRATGWCPQIFVVGAQRKYIKSMHILERPNRPFHFYGNTVRRIHYRQAAAR